MDMQAALRARLVGAAPVATLASDRVHWVERPQAEALPAITLQTISGGNETDYQTNQQTQSNRVQVDVWGKTYASVRALSRAVTDAIEPAHSGNGIRFERSFLESQSDLGEDTDAGFVHRISLDFIIWYAAL
jgi:hypothetical protein